MLILELNIFNFSQSRGFAHIYIGVYIEQIMHWKCVFMLYSSVYMYFYSIKGIASISIHLEILYYIYDYFSFLSNPTTTTTEMLFVVQNVQDSHRIAI